MNPIVVIPARLASTRLPDKPLADIHGRPMIVHVWRRAMDAGVGPVLVACAEAAVAAAVEAALEALAEHVENAVDVDALLAAARPVRPSTDSGAGP